MTKPIFPGNYVNHLGGNTGQSVIATPGREFVHLIGYAKVDAVGGTSFDVIIPSPDKRTGNDKLIPDITGMVVPVGASLMHLGLRIVDMRRDKAIGSATSGLVGTNTNLIKLASAVSVVPGALTATTASTPGVAIASTTAAPTDVKTDPLINNGVIITGSPLTLKVYVENASQAAGSTLSSSLTEGSYFVCECVYAQPADVPTEDAFGGFPGIIES